MMTWIKVQFESWIETRRNLAFRATICESCENLKSQNAYLQSTINRLLDKQLEKSVEVHATNQGVPVSRPVQIPWSVQRHRMESESRKQADELLKKKNEELQEELTKGKTNAI